MRFDELVITIQDEELRVRFHPELTVLSGLAVLERQSLADSFLGALTAGTETTELRYTDGEGRPVTLVCRDGRASASFEDGAPAPTPIGSVAATPAALRSLLLVRASDLAVPDVTPREDEPPELQEARATLAALTGELDDALRAQQSQADARARLHELDELIAVARDGAARREYAQVLARLERVRAEAAAVRSGASGIETDRHLLSASPEARQLAERWRAAADRLAELTDRFGATERLTSDDLAAATVIPDEPPTDLDAVTAAAAAARADHASLDHRLQELAVATLPAPSDPVVAELGLLDQHELWGTAERIVTALDEVDRLHVAHGGLGVDEAGPGPAVIDEIEAAHRDLEEAEQAAESTRVLGVAASGFGVAIALAGLMSSAVLIALGLAIALGAGMALLVLPKQRIARAVREEAAVLARAGATSYLGFHMRRVDASVDPHMREQVAAAMVEQRRASTAWEQLVGPGVDPRRASALEAEIRAYNTALRSLGGAADEIEQLRAELAERAEPARAQAMDVLRARCEPFGLRPADLDDLDGLRRRVAERIHVGRTARLQLEVEDAEADEQKAASRLDDLLLQLGFGDGELDARLGALEWAVSQAAEREESRARARPTADIEAEQRDLESTARSLRRPEWDTVTAADATTPDIAELERERRELMSHLVDTASEEEIERLADRQAAIERRVLALEARNGGHDANGDPGAVADIQQNLLARMAAAAEAGPHRDPVPMILDEALLRVPADRKWDLLDLLLRLAERHQLIYLSDDAFVAAWARQQAADGNITLLEPSPT